MKGEIEVRQSCSRSMLDPRWGPVLAGRIGDALAARLQSCPGVFLTLTYDREGYGDARALYRAQSEERHVRRFIDRLEAWLGESLRGRWIRRMEFQRGGWVHFHLMILGVSFVPQTVLMELWGRGFVSVKRANGARARYFAKYVSGADDLPAFIYLERPRSVKLFAASPGFWGGEKKGSGVVERRARMPFYVPIWMMLRRRRGRVSVRDTCTGHVREIVGDVVELLGRMRSHGCEVSGGSRRGWLRVVHHCRWGLPDAVVELAQGPRARPSALDLNTCTIPPLWEALRELGLVEGGEC